MGADQVSVRIRAACVASVRPEHPKVALITRASVKGTDATARRSGRRLGRVSHALLRKRILAQNLLEVQCFSELDK
jgi:hypothetical protein